MKVAAAEAGCVFGIDGDGGLACLLALYGKVR